MKKIVFLFSLLLYVTGISAQTQGEFLVELDPATGDMTKIGSPIPGIHWVYPGVRTYDEINGRMIFNGGDPVPDHLYSVDISDGSVVSNPFVVVAGQGGFLEPHFDNGTGTTYGLYYNNSSFYLATMDLITGIPVQVGTNAITGLSGVSQGMDTYDEINQRYFVLSGNVLYAVDAQTGNLLGDPPLNNPPGTGILQVVYNNANDTLYGLMIESNTQWFYLVWIDPATGAVNQIGSGTALAAGNGTATIDQANRHYIFTYSDQSGFYLAAMDLNTGAIVHHNPIVLDNQDNVLNIKYDNTRHRLFGIHWDDNIQWPLKLNLLSFNARNRDNSTAAVSWKVADADGGEIFYVEHSTDGKAFSTVAALDYLSGQNDYAVNHAMEKGNNFYRLRIKDVNGNITFSKTVRLWCGEQIGEMVLLPNVVAGSTTLYVPASEGGTAALIITDASGQEVYKAAHILQKGGNSIDLNLSGLATGTYILHVQQGSDAVVPLRFVKI